MKRRGDSERGMALLLSVIATIVILGAVLLVTRQATSSKFDTDLAQTQLSLEEACKAGIDIGIEEIWNQYVIGNGNTTGNLASYRVFINDVLPNNGSTTVVDEADPVVLDEARELEVTGVTMSRADDLSGTVLTITASARAGEARQTARQTVRVSGTPFSGYDYAVLANNINCILCHASFRNLDQEYNTNPDLYGTFDRVKVATLEALLFRRTSADSYTAGTIYTRGNIYNENGSLMTTAQVQANDTLLDAYKFDTTNGKVNQSSTGAMTKIPLKVASVGSDGVPEQFANLYKDYPEDPLLMSDGPLPKTFPAPFEDADGDRYVDDSEFHTIADTLNGSITGGVAYGVPAGNAYTGTGLPATSNGALGQLSSTGAYNGNLILTGTAANPIVLNGEVAVNGDLVIRGKVRGWGQIFVKGNTYIVGDVTYADAPNKFGQAADGTRNGLSIVTGGSVLMGDYLTVRGKNTTWQTEKFPDSSKSIDVRTANKSVSVKNSSTGVTETLNIGYFDKGVTDAGEIQAKHSDGTPRQGQQYSFTTSELMLFNNLELQKAVADPNYVPRFYGLKDSQPNNIYVYTKPSEEHAVKYDESGNTVKKLRDQLIAKGYPLSILDRAAYHFMNPDGNWLSEDQLRKIWWDDEMSRTSRNSTWLFDGLLYSNNAIFTITRSYARHKSYTEGKMRIRGAVICPDLGVLVAGPDSGEAFTLLYDKRVREFWSPNDPSQVFFARQVYEVLPMETESGG